MNKSIIRELRREKSRLQKLAMKKEMAMRKAERARKEEKRLKQEIRKLKIRTSNNLLAKARRKVGSVKVDKKKAKQLKKTFIKGFKEFQKFADKYGEKID